MFCVSCRCLRSGIDSWIILKTQFSLSCVWDDKHLFQHCMGSSGRWIQGQRGCFDFRVPVRSFLFPDKNFEFDYNHMGPTRKGNQLVSVYLSSYRYSVTYWVTYQPVTFPSLRVLVWDMRNTHCIRLERCSTSGYTRSSRCFTRDMEATKVKRKKSNSLSTRKLNEELQINYFLSPLELEREVEHSLRGIKLNPNPSPKLSMYAQYGFRITNITRKYYSIQ